MEESPENGNLLETIILSNKYTKIIEILSENQLTCQINILGETKFKDDEELSKFILKIHKKEFNLNINYSNNNQSLEELKKICSSPKKYFENDIYSKYLTEGLFQNKIDVELIYPATQKQIDKNRLYILKRLYLILIQFNKKMLLGYLIFLKKRQKSQ